MTAKEFKIGDARFARLPDGRTFVLVICSRAECAKTKDTQLHIDLPDCYVVVGQAKKHWLPVTQAEVAGETWLPVPRTPPMGESHSCRMCQARDTDTCGNMPTSASAMSIGATCGYTHYWVRATAAAEPVVAKDPRDERIAELNAGFTKGLDKIDELRAERDEALMRIKGFEADCAGDVRTIERLRLEASDARKETAEARARAYELDATNKRLTDLVQYRNDEIAAYRRQIADKERTQLEIAERDGRLTELEYWRREARSGGAIARNGDEIASFAALLPGENIRTMRRAYIALKKIAEITAPTTVNVERIHTLCNLGLGPRESRT